MSQRSKKSSRSSKGSTPTRVARPAGRATPPAAPPPPEAPPAPVAAPPPVVETLPAVIPGELLAPYARVIPGRGLEMLRDDLTEEQYDRVTDALVQADSDIQFAWGELLNHYERHRGVTGEGLYA